MEKTYRLFISHSWAYSDSYDRIVKFLNEQRLNYCNHSVPKDDPIHTKGTDKQLREAIEAKIKGTSCILILAGVYSTYSKWINKEIEIAKYMNKKIIAIQPWGSERTSQIVKDNADIIVGWNGKTIVDAIKKIRIMRRRARALVVGINYYASEDVLNLYGCVNDAYEVKNVLEKDADGTRNFDVHFETAVDENSAINRKTLKDLVHKLFDDESDIALFYFSGHGYLEDSGGYLVTSECEEGDEGMLMSEILEYANNSKATNKIIILDCCHSGKMGQTNKGNDTVLSVGMTILTASTENQYSSEVNGSGIFTKLLVDALNGAAANILGEITPGSVYAHIDKSLGSWAQRPMFKTNVKEFINLRETLPSISIDDLKLITQLFPNKEEHLLNPSYEPDSESPNSENCEKFKILQKYNRLNLVVPINTEHMYYAAMESKACRLTAFGEHYWDLIKNNRIY